MPVLENDGHGVRRMPPGVFLPGGVEGIVLRRLVLLEHALNGKRQTATVPCKPFFPQRPIDSLEAKPSPVTLVCGLNSDMGMGGGGENPIAYAAVYPP